MPHPARFIDLLRSRAAGIPDDRCAALVLPGGGMRATWQVAALASLAHSGLHHHLDMVVGSSAGAINGCALAAGDLERGVRTYTHQLSGWRFINPARPWKVMDVDYLVDHVIGRQRAISAAAVRSSGLPVHIVLTDATTGQPHTVASDHPELFDVLRATAALPLLYGRRVRVDGVPYVDGGVTAPVPWQQAVALGATDLLVIAPMLPGTRYTPVPDPVMRLIRLAVARNGAGPRQAFDLVTQRFEQAMEVIEGGRPVDGVAVHTLFPSDPARLCHRIERDRGLLMHTARMGREDMDRLVC